LPTILKQNQQLLNTLAKHTKPISILETLKEKILPSIELLMQLLQTIKRPDGALKDIYLSYSED
jgi:hypothetical protein